MNPTARLEKQTALGITADDLAPVRALVRTCIQCGTCTGSCPNAFAMDLMPRQLWRTIMIGNAEAVFQSDSFHLCTSCYCCTLRCPRGLPLTEAMIRLKQLAHARALSPVRPANLFHESFLRSVQQYGRVRETDLMLRYFISMRDPWLPLKFASLGWKMLTRGKASVSIPRMGEGVLAALFQKVAVIEEKQ